MSRPNNTRFSFIFFSRREIRVYSERWVHSLHGALIFYISCANIGSKTTSETTRLLVPPILVMLSCKLIKRCSHVGAKYWVSLSAASTLCRSPESYNTGFGSLHTHSLLIQCMVSALHSMQGHLKSGQIHPSLLNQAQ